MTQRESNQENSLPTSNDQTLSERLRDCVKVTFSAGLHGVESDCRQAAEELDRQRAEIERLTRERDEARNASLPGSATVFAAVEAERDRLRAALEKIADFDCRSDEHVGDMKCWSCYAREALSSEPSADETAGDWLTNEQCDDVIAFLEDYEWTGLTRENVRTWCTAIACARFEVERLTGELDEARKPPHCPTCGCGR